MLKKFYLILGAGLIGTYLTASVMGYEFFGSNRQRAPKKYRHTSSFRSYFLAPIFIRRGK